MNGLYIGVPAIVGRGGLEKILEIPLTETEKEQLDKSIAAVTKTCAEVDAIAGK